MAISLNLANITNAIQGISISGVTIKDKDEISASWKPIANVLYPNPEGFISNFNMSFPAMVRGDNSPADVSYILNYRFLGTQIGSVGDTQGYTLMVDKVITILNAIIAVHAPYSGRVEMEVKNISVGARADPVGNLYHGADIGLLITEMVN